MSATTITAHVVGLSFGGGFHPAPVVVIAEHYAAEAVREITYTCPTGEAPAIGAEIKVTVEVQP